MSIIVFQHGGQVGPGRLGMTLRDHGFHLDIRRLDLPLSRSNPLVPPDFDDVEGVISMGGEQNVTDIARHPWMQAEAEYLREAHRRQLPLVGICLGHQLIAHALGGAVAPAAKPEYGFFRVRVEVPGQTDTILAGIPWDSHQFECHSQEVAALPPGATLLATSDHCRVQAFRAGLRTYAFQYHFECDRESALTIGCGEPDGPPGQCVPRPEMARQCDAYYPMFARTADRLSVNLAAFLFPLQRRLSA